MTAAAREITAHLACATADRMFMHRPFRERTPASAADRVSQLALPSRCSLEFSALRIMM
jgi:hypothetical protein